MFLALATFTVFAQPKGKDVTVKGEVVDLWCYMDSGARGASHKSCAVTCAEAGNPIGIVDDKGDVYMVLGTEKHQVAKDMLINKMAETVTVEGTLVKKGGLHALYVKTVK